MIWKRWQDWSNVILGVWLFSAPYWMTPYDTSSAWNAWILGILIIAAALWALAVPESRAAEWSNVMFGAWMFVAPWILGFSVSAAVAWNAWIVGALVVLLSLGALSGQGRGAATAH